MGSALDGIVFDFTQIQAYLVHNMSSSKLYLAILVDSFLFWSITFLWVYGSISSIEITPFLLADILLQHKALFKCLVVVQSF